MDVTGDELAGVVDLFGGLTAEELSRALAELAFRQGGEYDPDEFAGVIDDATRSYHLVRLDVPDVDDPILVPGPVAFPDLPEDARDLPHILDIEKRSIDTERASKTALDRFREDAVEAIQGEDVSRIETLLDASYELEAWGDMELSEIRERLDDALESR